MGSTLLYAKVNYVFQELHGYASIRNPDTGIEVGFQIFIRSFSFLSIDIVLLGRTLRTHPEV